MSETIKKTKFELDDLVFMVLAAPVFLFSAGMSLAGKMFDVFSLTDGDSRFKTFCAYLVTIVCFIPAYIVYVPALLISKLYK